MTKNQHTGGVTKEEFLKHCTPLSPDHPGFFDIENPWEEGTVLLGASPESWTRVVEVNLEDACLTVARKPEYPTTVLFAYWNQRSHLAKATTRVITPDDIHTLSCSGCALGEGNERYPGDDAECSSECLESRMNEPAWEPSTSLWPEAAQKTTEDPTDEPEVAENAESVQTESTSPIAADDEADPILCCECNAEIVKGAECVQDDGQFCCVQCDAKVNRPHLTDSQERRLFKLTHEIIQRGSVIRRHEGFVESAKVNLSDCKKDLSDAIEKRRSLEGQVMEILTDAEKGQGNLLDVAEDAGAAREKAFTAIVAVAPSDEVKAFELISASDDGELMTMLMERADTEVKISANVIDAAVKRHAEIEAADQPVLDDAGEEDPNAFYNHLLESLRGATDKGRLAMIANSKDPVWLALIVPTGDPNAVPLPDKVLEAARERRDVLLAEAKEPTEEEAAAEASLKAKHEEWMKKPLSSLLDPGLSASVIDSLKSCSPSIRTIKQWAEHVAKQSGNDKPIEWGIKGIGEATVTKIENAVEADLARFNIKNQ